MGCGAEGAVCAWLIIKPRNKKENAFATFFIDALVRQYMDGVHPYFCGLRPSGHGKLSATQAIAMSALGVDMQLGWDLGVLQGHEVDHRILYVDGIVFRLHQKCGRGLLSGMDIGIGSEVLLCDREVAGINDEREVG